MDNLENREFITTKKSGKAWREIFESKEFEEKYCYEGNDLGANYSKDETIFKVWAPTAEDVVLNIYKDGYKSTIKESFQMEYDEKGVWIVKVEGDLHKAYYTYTINADGTTNETGDVYAKACGVNSLRSMVVDLSRTNPEGWEDDKHVVYPLDETEIWEVHIGDFSNDINSGVKKEYRGKYLAFTEENTTLKNDNVHPTCLSYLKDLGITHVHLLPSFDYGSIDESSNEGFNWGYDPVNYNVPEGSYSTDPFNGEVRIMEFKKMVQALHKAGLSVVMDVVYNHTYSLDSNFNKTVPYYYYREEEDGTYCNGSACGNDTASERRMYQKYMIDSVLYWMNEYHVDGFRFDLMGLHDTETMNLIREAINKSENGKDIIIYGEPWSAGPSNFKDGYKPATKDAIRSLNDGISIFNDDTRDAAKGKFNELESPGFVNGGVGFEERIKRAFCGLIDDSYKEQPKQPNQIINYVSAHDNSTFWDKLVDSVKKNKDYLTKDEELLSMNKLGAAFVQLSYGIPFMQAGEEAGRTKLGEDNSYNLSKELNKLDWSRMYDFEDLMNYYKGLIALRKELKNFYDLSKYSLENINWIDNLPEQVIGCKVKAITKGTWNEIIIIFNASKNDVKVNINGEWNLLVNKNFATPEARELVKESLLIEAISATVIGKK
ncbi:MAG: type I pullulanase [Clostridium sp.]|nr:type I pullulanase [Clostridium sp.]